MPALARGEVDLAVVADFGDGTLPHAPHLRSVPLAHDELMAVLPAGHTFGSAAARATSRRALAARRHRARAPRAAPLPPRRLRAARRRPPVQPRGAAVRRPLRPRRDRPADVRARPRGRRRGPAARARSRAASCWSCTARRRSTAARSRSPSTCWWPPRERCRAPTDVSHEPRLNSGTGGGRRCRPATVPAPRLDGLPELSRGTADRRPSAASLGYTQVLNAQRPAAPPFTARQKEVGALCPHAGS